MYRHYKRYLIAEMLFLFLIIPLSFLLYYPTTIKVILTLVSFIYVVALIFRNRSKIRETKKTINWRKFWINTGLKFFGLAVLTIIGVYFYNPELLFKIVRERPVIWIKILFIYSLLSVYPQEVIYRVFFFSRYERLFRDKRLLIFVNGLFFAAAHVFFRNEFVLLLTFLGGMFFAYTYHKTRSTSMIFIEHTLYGYWIFTVGLGGLLGFPS